jgi:hypothetical protein
MDADGQVQLFGECPIGDHGLVCGSDSQILGGNLGENLQRSVPDERSDAVR